MDERTALVAEIAGRCAAVRLRLISRAVSRLFDEELRAQPLRISQMNILVAIAHGGPCRPGDVCRWLALDKSTLSRDLERLVAAGWLERRAVDGRRHELAATPAGLAVLEAALPAWRAAQQRVEEAFGREALGTVETLARQALSLASA